MAEDRQQSQAPLELWGGVECTVNRVCDAYFDQLELSGHAQRLDDLDRFAALGIKTLRYPVLWERTAPAGAARADWAWADTRLARLRVLGISPIVGLVHHGSGPPDTDLLDPGFPRRLAAYARSVATRYPWVERYTPVNEPLTTARFSGLYGHWYPHGRDARVWARALLQQCRATVLAMAAIRRVVPGAQLVQTEDLGKVYSTPRLAYQAEFENTRRWLSFDLLCGRVDRSHPMWGYLRWVGVPEADLAFFLARPCPPDMLGINYYVTSDRYLDEELGRHPPDARGGNGRHTYADVALVRGRPEAWEGVGARLREAWERYRLPLAVTEVHLGCTREEQLRWLREAWEAAYSLWEEGADMRAVTVWALLGSYNWDSLVTRPGDHYEPGAFDVRGAAPRTTALAHQTRDLAAGLRRFHPLTAAPGWWRSLTAPRGAARPLLVAGASGTLGRAFGRVCAARGLACRLLSRQEMDVAEPASVGRALDELAPWAVVNATGYVRVDDAEAEPERCFRENVQGPATLAAACAARGLPLLTFSSDLVFDGAGSQPYTEEAPAAPLNVYGRSKAAAEERVQALHPGALIVRTSAFFGPWDGYNFVAACLAALDRDESFAAIEDVVISPTYVPDLVNACLDLLIDAERGVWHVANGGAVSWLELGRAAAELAGARARRVAGRPLASFGLPARRPAYSALGSARAMLLRGWEDALSRYFAERGAAGCGR